MRWLLALCLSTSFSQNLPPELIRLTQIRRHMAERLRQVPDYTCLETVQRFSSGRRVDTVRLDVAEVDGKEMFAWSGAPRFDGRDLETFVSRGTISSGIFAAYARSLFYSDGATFQYAGGEPYRGNTVDRYDYQLSVLVSGFELTTATGTFTTAVKGSFLADRRNLDAVQIHVEAEDIPPASGVYSALTDIDYAPVRLGESAALLPQSGTVQLIDLQGVESRNWISFSHCRQYSAESLIRFENPAEGALPPSRAVAELDLPAGLILPLALETEVDSDKSAVGDPLRATLTADVVWKRKVLLPKGASVSGRIRRLERGAEPGHWIVALEFSELQFGATHARFYANMREIRGIDGIVSVLETGKSRKKNNEGPYIPGDYHTRYATSWGILTADDIPGTGIFFVDRKSFRLPAGTRMVWRTVK